MKLNRGILAAAASASLAMPANASVIYDNGAPNTTDGNEATQWVQAEDFSFAGGTTVGGAGVYIAGLAGNIAAWDGNFTYFIFANAGGMPGSTLQTGNVSASPVNTGLPAFQGNSYLFAFDFQSPFDAVAGTTYWLGIHLSSNFNRDQIYWVTTGGNVTARGEENDGGTLNVWSSNGQEHAFYLTDLTGTSVPEPGTWAMMLLGFGAAGWALRCGRKPKLTAA